MVKMVHSRNFTLAERKKNFTNLKPLMSQLEGLFEKRVGKFNLLAKSMGYDNYLEYSLVLKVIPQKEFDLFLKNVDRFVSLVHSDFPSTKLEKEVKDWSILSIPAPEGILGIEAKIKNFKEVLDIIAEYDQRVDKYKKRIEIKTDSNVYGASTEYVVDRNIVSIVINKNLIDLDKTLLFVHELGHALDMLNCEDKKIIPYNLPKYLQEFSALEFTFNFIKKTLSKKKQKIIRYNLLHTLACTLFEIDVFINDQQDYDKAYAKAINRCYLKARQTKNPLYLFNNRFIFRPLGMLISNMVNVELYLKQTQKKEKRP